MEKPIDIKDKEGFECEMKRRMALGVCGGFGYQMPIGCTKDGRPRTRADKRVICEMQKLALGLSEYSYTVCGPVREGVIPPGFTVRSRGTNRARYWRVVALYYPREDREFFLKVVAPLTLGEKRRPAPVGGCLGPSGAAVCAYPGGCD